jgi:hypothetical protein
MKIDELINEAKTIDPNIAQIRGILKSNFTIKGKIIISNNIVDVVGDCKIKNDIEITKLPVQFGNVSGDFYCNNNQLITLHGAPSSVGGSFYCNGNRLTTLQGAPTSVGGDFYCSGNQLTTLEGAPSSVGGNFYCQYNQLTTLEGAPISVGGEFHCSYNNSLPLLRLLLIKDVKKISFRSKNDIIENILNKYLGQGRGGALACAAELTKAGFKGNARL